MRYLLLFLVSVSVSAGQTIRPDGMGGYYVTDTPDFAPPGHNNNYSQSFQRFGQQPSLLNRVEQQRGLREYNNNLQLQNELLRRQLGQ